MCLHTQARNGARSTTTHANGTAPSPVSWFSIDPRSPRFAAALDTFAGATVYVRHRRFCGPAELLRACGSEIVINPQGKTSPTSLLVAELYHLHIHQ